MQQKLNQKKNTACSLLASICLSMQFSILMTSGETSNHHYDISCPDITYLITCFKFCTYAVKSWSTSTVAFKQQQQNTVTILTLFFCSNQPPAHSPLNAGEFHPAFTANVPVPFLLDSFTSFTFFHGCSHRDPNI